jgi:hypothetical protein
LTATEGSTWTPYRSSLTRTFAASAAAGCPAALVPDGRAVLQEESGRPAATAAAAAPPRSRLRREIRGDEMCRRMAYPACLAGALGFADGCVLPCRDDGCP